MSETYSDSFRAPERWNLTRQEARFFALIMDHETVAPRDYLLANLHDPPRRHLEANIVKVLICRVRRKLAPFGVALETHWGVGVYIDEATKAKLRAGAIRVGPAIHARNRAKLRAELAP